MQSNSVLLNYVNSNYASNINSHIQSLSEIRQQGEESIKYGHESMYEFRGDGTAGMTVGYVGQTLYDDNVSDSKYVEGRESVNSKRDGVSHVMESSMKESCYYNAILEPHLSNQVRHPVTTSEGYAEDQNIALPTLQHYSSPASHMMSVSEHGDFKRQNVMHSSILNATCLSHQIGRNVEGAEQDHDNNRVVVDNAHILANGQCTNTGGGGTMGDSTRSLPNLNVPGVNDAMMTNGMQHGHLIDIYSSRQQELSERHSESGDNLSVEYNGGLYIDHEEDSECHTHSENGKMLCMEPQFRHPPIRPEFHEVRDEAIELVVGPAKHQVKEFNILPLNVLRISYNAKNSDYIIVQLICDKQIRRHDPSCIFLAGVSAKYSVSDNGECILPNMKISKDMLQGRTKGFKFYLSYTLIMEGQVAVVIRSEPFQIWSNVNQLGFPRKQRERHIQERKDTNKKKRKLSA